MDEDTKAQVRDWTVVTGAFVNNASRIRRGQEVTVDLDTDDLTVNVDEGCGFNSYSTTVGIPVEIIIKMLEHAGYTFTKTAKEGI